MVKKRRRMICEICGKAHKRSRMIPMELLNPVYIEIIKEFYPHIKDGFICLSDFNKIHVEHIKDSLEEDKGDLSPIEEDVVESLEDNDLISENINELYQEQLTWGEKVADKIAEFGGSWTFIISFIVFMLIWMGINIFFLTRPFDKYPFILLNLILSTLAAIQAPIILMSQNRQAEKDRFQAEQDYKTNLKAELQIQQVSERLNFLMDNQISTMLENQENLAKRLDDMEGKR